MYTHFLAFHERLFIRLLLLLFERASSLPEGDSKNFLDS